MGNLDLSRLRENYLIQLQVLKEMLDEVTTRLENTGRAAIGTRTSYAEVGKAIGCSKQRAYQRFRPSGDRVAREWFNVLLDPVVPEADRRVVIIRQIRTLW